MLKIVYIKSEGVWDVRMGNKSLFYNSNLTECAIYIAEHDLQSKSK